MNFPLTKSNLTSVVGWELKESSIVGGAKFNPINSTLSAPGVSAFNTIHTDSGGVIHVWNYVSCQQGLDKTVETINNGRYEDIKSALKTSTDPSIFGHMASLNVWGTHNIPVSIMSKAKTMIK